jgi:hypothetical protein
MSTQPRHFEHNVEERWRCVSPLVQWTSTELTMQHSQMARIVADSVFLQIALRLFGGVRVAEALLSVCTQLSLRMWEVKGAPECTFTRLRLLGWRMA